MRLGFSTADVRRMDMTDFVAFCDVAFGEDARVPVPREASQADIDDFMR